MNSLFGWRNLSPSLRLWFNNLDKGIVLFPHTSRWDLFTILTYTMTYTELHNIIWVVIQQSGINRLAFDYFLHKYFNRLEVPKRGKNQLTGFIDKTVNTLKDRDKYLVFLSPSGAPDVKPRKWKSGYYILAQRLKIPITIVGFDYIEHRITIPVILKPNWDEFEQTGSGKIIVEFPEKSSSDTYSIKITQSELFPTIEKLSKHYMGCIVPLHPRYSHIPIKKYSGTPTSIHGSTKIIILLIIILIIIIIALIIRWRMRRCSK